MAAAFVSSSATTYGSRTNTTLTAPTGIQDGDNLIIIHLLTSITVATLPAVTPPSGFTLIGTPTLVSEGNNPAAFSATVSVYRKIASGESGDYTLTHTTEVTDGYIVAIRGGTSGAVPTPVTADGDGTGDMTTPSITTTINDSFILYWAHNWQLFGSSAVPSGSTPSWNERLDSASNLIYIADGVLATAGATGTKTKASGNGGANDQWATGLVAIEAVGGPVTLALSGSASTSATGTTAPNFQIPL